MKNRKIRFYRHSLLCFVVILCSFPSSVVRLTTRAVSAKRPGQIVYLSGHSGNHTSRITRSEIKSSSEPSETSNARPARQIKDHKGVTSKSQTKKKKKRLRHSGRLLGRPNPSKCSRRPKQMSHGSHNYFLSGLATNSIFVRLFYLKKITVITVSFVVSSQFTSFFEGLCKLTRRRPSRALNLVS